MNSEETQNSKTNPLQQNKAEGQIWSYLKGYRDKYSLVLAQKQMDI